jgi:hypothetical protein
MKINTTLQDQAGRSGTSTWNSDTGKLGGTFARELAIDLDQAVTRGAAGWGAKYDLGYPIKDPYHDTVEMAVMLEVAGFELRPELAAVYPMPPDGWLPGRGAAAGP